MAAGAVQPPPRTSTPAPGHRVYPYLLGGVDVVEPDQAWCVDITQVPVMSGSFYVVAVMDWAIRRVLSWRLSNTVEVGFCLEALEDALRGGAPGDLQRRPGLPVTLGLEGVALGRVLYSINAGLEGRCTSEGPYNGPQAFSSEERLEENH